MVKKVCNKHKKRVHYDSTVGCPECKKLNVTAEKAPVQSVIPAQQDNVAPA